MIFEAYEFQKKQLLQHLNEADSDVASKTDLPEKIREFKEAHGDMTQYVDQFSQVGRVYSPCVFMWKLLYSSGQDACSDFAYLALYGEKMRHRV